MLPNSAHLRGGRLDFLDVDRGVRVQERVQLDVLHLCSNRSSPYLVSGKRGTDQAHFTES